MLETWYLLFVFFCGEAVYQIPLPGKGVCEQVLHAVGSEVGLVENEDGRVAPRTLACVVEGEPAEVPCPENLYGTPGAVWIP
jgi:hypothetical protein